MKKLFKIFVPVIVLLITVFALAGPVLADDPTEVNVTWDGAGNMGVNVNSGDSNGGFGTGGNAISGTFNVKDYNDNPYSYSVDTFSTYLNASVTNGALNTGIARVNSYAGMYGNGGQTEYAAVIATGGTASMAFRSTTNYAALVDATYGYQLTGGHNIVVTADYYRIDRSIVDGRGNDGGIFAEGTGTATLDCMSSEASGNGNLRFGWGAGCYTDASYSATGASGYFQVCGRGNDSIVYNGLGLQSGGGMLQVIANWVNSFNIVDYSLTAH